MSAGGYRRSLARAATMPPGELAKKAVRRLLGGARRAVAYATDEREGTYALDHVEPPLAALFPLPSRAALAARRAELEALGAQYLEHRFDLLGSGWTRVAPGMRCRGVGGHRYAASAPAGVNRSNAGESARIAALLDPGYARIDWQLDFKSGHRWSESTWYRRVAVYDTPPGADVKVPWELGRCQHLPQLALLHALWQEERPADAARLAREFRNQVLDFVAANPPRYGVQWACAMDVAIRAANWLVAHDLFSAGGAGFDPEFARVFRRSVYEHGRHVAANLEWNERVRSNHYLADLAGLAFCAAHLAPSTETDTWLAFALQELAGETLHQFLPDGGGCEASTSYHRLSAEIVCYTAALLQVLPAERLDGIARASSWRPAGGPRLAGRPAALVGDRLRVEFPPAFLARLAAAAGFTRAIRRPDGRTPQIGDNDSGRFLHLDPVGALSTVGESVRRHASLEGYDELPPHETIFAFDSLDHRHLLGALGALLGRGDLRTEAGSYRIDAETVGALVPRGAGAGPQPGSKPPPTGGLASVRAGIAGRCAAAPVRYDFGTRGHDVAGETTLAAFPDFGLYVFRSSALYLAVRCGPVVGDGAHAHNDQLAIELWLAGEPVVLDPGSYVYTALPAERNRYRSVRAHFAPWIAGREPGDLGDSLFALRNAARARCLYAGVDGFAGVHDGYGFPVYRVVAVEPDGVRVEDFADGSALEPCPLGPVDARPRFPPPELPVSDGYGTLVRAP
jgi:hypothetical protein